MAHDMIWYENRRTPEVVSKGQTGKKGGAGTAAGKVVKRRAATAEEEKAIARGDWVRVNRDGKKPGQPGYMARKSKVRPQNNSAEGVELSTEEERGEAVIVVALPASDDPVNLASSEKVPHLTVLYFGKNVAAGDIGWLKGVVKEAAAKMQPFTATVTSREPLGDDGADVLMVDPGKQMLDARSQMLDDHTTKVMFDAVEQYPKWTPHVTLGYPDTPAKGEPSDTIRFDRLAVWDGDYEGEEYPMGAAMTASSHWVPYTLTAAAGICAPLEDLTRNKVRILLPLSDRDAGQLVVEGIVGQDLSVPLMDLGSTDDFSEDQKDRLVEILESMASSREHSMPADLGIEYGNTDGVLWTKPHIDGLHALRARLVAELAQNNVPFQRALPDPVVNFATIGDNPVPDFLADNTPQRVYFDRLALQVGDDVYDFPFGMLGSAAPMTAGGLVVDGDAISSLASEVTSPPEVTHDANSGKGSRFRIPLLVPEGVPTGDGRKFKPLSLTTRDLPLPLMWQIKTSDGHDGSVVVGRIDTIDRVDGGLGNALGVFDSGPYGRECERMVREKMLRGVSADLDQFEAVAEQPEPELAGDEDDVDPDGGKAIKAAEILVSRARVMGVTVVAKPAFQECFIELVNEDSEQEEPLVADGTYFDAPALVDAEALVACAMVASHIPVNPPSNWFDNPMLRQPTPLTVDDDGRVFGHIAAWHVDHIGLPFGTRPPRSRSNYAYFHTGVVRTAESKDIPVGQLTLAGGHAALDLSAREAVKHYDDTASAVADVHAGEDAYGIWVAGGLRPGTTPEQIRALRASAPSGDWRPVAGRLELVAVCQVNVPGFPIARARVASGYVTALVAAGASALAELRGPTVEDRIAMLERETNRDRAREDAAMAVRRFRTTELASTGVTNFRAYSKETLENYAKKGWAHKNKDGHISYPIADVADLRRAIRAYGRASKEDKPAIRKHIMRRARGLDRPDLIPEQWMKSAAIKAHIELSKKSPDMELVEDGAYALTASLKYRRPISFEEANHPRDESGKFRKVLFKLKADLEGKTGTKPAIDEIDAAINADDNHDPDAAKDAAGRLIVELDKIADDTADLDDKEDLKRRSADVATVIAQLPMAQGNADVKMRFTDLPQELRDLIDDLLSRLKSAVTAEVYAEVAGPMSQYISGADYMHSDEIQSHLTRIMRYLI